MTTWDKIYKNFQKGGEAWATLSEGIHPLFISFVDQSTFSKKHVLDIGCGTGKYLRFLKELGFQTNGIDSSETAVKMTKEALGDDSLIVCEDMFNFQIPKNTFDLIISTSAIHHGEKNQVNALIGRIFEALIDGGSVFITLPDLNQRKEWDTFQDEEQIAEGTFAPLSGPEKGLPHSFYLKEEVEELFSKFRKRELDLDEHGRWIMRAVK